MGKKKLLDQWVGVIDKFNYMESPNFFVPFLIPHPGFKYRLVKTGFCTVNKSEIIVSN